MDTIKELDISTGYRISKSTTSKLLGFNLIGNLVKVGVKLKLEKEGKLKSIDVGSIVKIDGTTYHILNSNIGIIIKKK